MDNTPYMVGYRGRAGSLTPAHTLGWVLVDGYELKRERLTRKLNLDAELYVSQLQRSEADESTRAGRRQAAQIKLRGEEMESSKKGNRPDRCPPENTPRSGDQE